MNHTTYVGGQEFLLYYYLQPVLESFATINFTWCFHKVIRRFMFSMQAYKEVSILLWFYEFAAPKNVVIHDCNCSQDRSRVRSIFIWSEKFGQIRFIEKREAKYGENHGFSRLKSTMIVNSAST